MNISNVLLLAVLLSSFGSAERQDSGIVNGREAKPHSKPYMASVQQGGHHICGGFLVSESFVMTAAHCFTWGKNLTVLLGAHDLHKKDGSVRIAVKFYHIHPGFDSETLYNDILLLQLEKPAPMSRTIQQISLPKTDKDVKPKTVCNVAGWGRTGDKKPAQQHLMEANVTTVDRKVCKTAWGKKGITAKMLCAGGSVDQKGFCQGDSGGPLVCKKTAAGIVSFMEYSRCSSPSKPNVYTQVSRYLPWINCIMKSLPQAFLVVPNRFFGSVCFFDVLPAFFGEEIVNGKKAKKNSLQYMVSVQQNGKHLCGGFLISPNFVLTAAHCDHRTLTVVLGSHNIKNQNIQRFKVEQKYKHPLYNNVESGSDIMLLQLSKNVTFSRNIKKVQIPLKAKTIKANSKCLVAGWGRNQTEGKTVTDLLVAEVETIDIKVCRQQWNQKKIPENIICAGGFRSNKGACQGDSGGPLVCSGLAVGIVSFNFKNNCKYPNLPNVYTEVSKFLPWIRKITKTGY
ncbi:transmembrane protease serine 9-like [Arapaima gigas]